MSLEQDSSIDSDEARRKAMKVVRFELGTYLRLGHHEFDEEEFEFVFPITIRSPKLILDAQQKDAVDLRSLSEIQLGHITVDAKTGEVDRPRKSSLKKELRQYEEELNRAIQKALVSASGRQLSHLPFPENQFAKLEDILAQAILNDEVSKWDIELMDSDRDDDNEGTSYEEYVEDLLSLNLLKQGHQEDVYAAGDLLTKIQNDEDYDGHNEEMNAALGVYFESHFGDFDMVKRTLGPYLVIAGHYYRRALELDQMPTISESELREAVRFEYSGQRASRKEFKLSRYLIQLQEVGVLEPVYDRGERLWVGDDDIRTKLERQTDYLGEFSRIMSPSLKGHQSTFDKISD